MSKIDELLQDKIPKYELLKNFVLYGFFGVCAAFIEGDIVSVMNNYELLIPAVVAAIGATVGFFFTFTTNTFLNFKKTDDLLKRFISYGTIALIGIAIKSGIMFICYTVYDITPTINANYLNYILIFAVAAVQFVFNKLFTYKD